MKTRRCPDASQIQALVDVALGEEKADLVIRGGDVVNVYTGEILKGWSVAAKGEWIAYVGEDAGHTIGPETQVIEAAGKMVIPGLIDGHAHVAHTHAALDEFLKYVIRSGTTTLITETLDFCFALGYEGIVDFLDSVQNQPIKIFATAPSTPANGQSDYVGVITPAQFRRLLDREDILGLGESNWVRAVRGDNRLLKLFAETLSRGKRLEGHSAGARGNKLVAFAATGNSSCHEAITADEALDRLRLGMHVMIREGDVRSDLAAIAAVRGRGIDFRRLALTTDGIGARHLLDHGYLDEAVRKAIVLGFPPIAAIQMVTLNVAEHFGIDTIVGGIAPGKYADMVVTPDLKTLVPEYVISNGKLVAREGKLLVRPLRHAYPPAARRTVRLPRKFTARDFIIRVKGSADEVTCRVIDLGNGIANKEALVSMPVIQGELKSDTDRDILKLAAIDRITNSGKMFVGLVRGFGLKWGAFAATAAWDVANVLVAGASERDMAGAVNRIRELQGGSVVFADGKVLAELPMPIAGQISDLRMEAIAERLEAIQKELERMGCRLPYAHLMLNTLTTTIVPALRISTDGLLGIREGQVLDLVVDQRKR